MTANRANRLRKIRIALIAIALGIVALFGYPITKAVIAEANRSHALHDSLDKVSAPVVKLGFAAHDEWLDVPPAGIRVDVPRNTCSALVGVQEGSNAAVPVTLEMRDNAPVDGASPLVWCTCQQREVTVKIKASTRARAALRWLTVRAGQVGGIRVLSSRHNKGVNVVGTAASDGCADVVFATWAQRQSGGNLKTWHKDGLPFGLDLRSEGFRILGVFDKGQRFGIVESRKGECALVLPIDFKGGGLSLMNDEGDWEAENTNQAVGWCSYHTEAAYSLWRSARERRDWLVVAAPADLVGGMTGLRETAERYGSPRMVGVLGEKDLTEDALSALRASGVSFNSIVEATKDGLPAKVDNLVISFSLRKDGSYLPQVAPAIPLGCEPEQERDVPLINHVCVQARPQRWRADGVAENQGAAQGQVPFWLRMLATTEKPGAQRGAAKLLAFARRMTLMGFRPTMTEGIREFANGAQISWRDGVKQVVVVGVKTSPPWLVPLFVGKPWKLTGKIQVTPIAKGKSVRFRAPLSLGYEPNQRRVIAWRR